MTSWRTPTSIAASEPPRELEVDGGGRSDHLVLAGPFLHGWIYRARSGPGMYRLVPMEGDTLAWRHQVLAHVARSDAPPEALARLTHARQIFIGDRAWFMVRYEVEEGTLTLADLL